MPRIRPGREPVRVDNLICVVETDKCYGVLTLNTIVSNVDTRTVTHRDHVRSRFDSLLIWLPKSQTSNPDMKPSDIFPNLKITYPSKANPNMIPYKTVLSITVPSWLVLKKNLMGDSEQEEISDQDSNNNNASPNFNDAW